MTLLVNSTKTLKNLHKSFSISSPNLEQEEIFSISFYEVSITNMVKPDKDIKRKVNYPIFFHDENFQQARNRGKLS